MTGPGYIGVDGGGTKTHFVLIDSAGAVIAEHQGGPSYHLQVGVDGVRAVLTQGLTALLAGNAGTMTRVEHVFFGLPAFGEDALIDPILAEMPADILGHRRYTCGNDMVCGWAGSLVCEDGINIVAGTGSIGYGEHGGVTARAGGWGELFSDEGSAYWVAIQGLNAFSRMSDGRLPKTPLYAVFRDHLNLSYDIDICSRTMGDTAMTRDQIAGLSRLVTAAATDCDTQARMICRTAAAELATIVDAVRNALGFDPEEHIPVSYSGGLFTAQDAILGPFRAALSALSPNFQIRMPRRAPSYGAALYAMKCAARLRSSSN